MFDLRDAYNDITLGEIYQHISEYELWKKYCSNFEEINRPFRSELYDDKNPSCRIFKHDNGALLYKDFGDSGKVYNIIQYIMQKYACNYQETLNIICTDFNIRRSKVIFKKSTISKRPEETLLIKPKVVIDIVPQTFTIIDYDYWNQYHIPLTLLQEYNVYSARYVYLYKNDKVITFCYTKTNPIYAYKFKDGYKIYKPYEVDKKLKWMFSGKHTNIEGYEQLSNKSDILIITKSLKDVMVYRLLGYEAISLQAESNKLNETLANELIKRFKRIIINYDNDEEGIRGTNRIVKLYSFNYFYISDYKDISDYVKYKGLNEGKKLIDNKLKSLK